MNKPASNNLNEHRYRVLIDNAPEPVFILDVETGKFIDFNRNAENFFKLSPEELLTKGLLDLSPKVINGFEASTLALKYIQEGLQGGNPVFDWIHLDSEGNETPCEIRIVRFPPFERQLVRGSVIVITGRKLAEERLSKAQQELSEITERFQISTRAAKVGIWEWNLETDTSVWDETMCELYGISYKDFSPKNASWKDRIHPEDRERLDQETKAALRGEKEFNTEFRLIWPDQSLHYIKAVATVQNDSEGNAVRMIGTNWDITKEKEAERQKIRARQLELKNRELEQFAYVASHDLQEPLRTVIGFSGLLKLRNQEKLDKESNEHLSLISQAASRMNKLVKALLDYSRIGSNKMLIEVDCNEMIKNILVDLSVQVSETNASITVDPLPNIKGFQTELRMLFQNLISNAIKFRKPGVDPVIHISVKKKKEYWKFCISDNGIGIEPEYEDKIFVIFQRLHTIAEYEGTGIGLAHCQKIVDLHGGKIWLDTQPGEGSKFYFTILN